MVTIGQQPRYVSFAGDRGRYQLGCSGLTRGGRAARYGIGVIERLFDYGKSIFVRLNGMTLTFQRTEAPGRDPGVGVYQWGTVDQLRQLMGDNLYIGDLFDVVDPEAEESRLNFVLLAKEKGVLDMSITSDANEIALTFSVEEGEDESVLPNYNVQTAYEFADGAKSQWLHYVPVDGKVHIGTDLLKGYYGEPELPGRGESYAAREQGDALLKYRLRCYECYGMVPVAYGLVLGDWRLLLRGETVEEYAEAGVPDWKDEYQSGQIGGGRLRVIGSDTGKKCEVRRNQSEYIYLFWGDAAGTAEAKTVSGTLREWQSDGSERETALRELTLDGNKVYRLAVGPGALGVSADAAGYEIELRDGDRVVWRREWEVMPSYYYEHQLLIMDRYGLMRTWMAQYVKRSITFEADEVLNEGRRLYDITDRVEEFTAVGAKMRKEEAQRIAQSYGGDYTYIWANGQWCRVAVKPGSVQVEDEGGGMAQVTLEFVFVANKRNNIGRVEERRRGGTVDGALMTEDGFYIMTENGEIITI